MTENPAPLVTPKLAHYRHGRAIRIAEAEVDAYLARTYVPAKESAA